MHVRICFRNNENMSQVHDEGALSLGRDRHKHKYEACVMWKRFAESRYASCNL